MAVILKDDDYRYTWVIISGESKATSVCLRSSILGIFDQSNVVYNVTDFFRRRALQASSFVA